MRRYIWTTTKPKKHAKEGQYKINVSQDVKWKRQRVFFGDRSSISAWSYIDG
jgi:hypothetical protein